MNIAKTILALTLTLSTSSAQANELNFTFTNPNFGGDPFNGSFLLGLASQQSTATANSQGTSGPTGGIGGVASPSGPTIIIPINTGTPLPPQVGDAGVDQVDETE